MNQKNSLPVQSTHLVTNDMLVVALADFSAETEDQLDLTEGATYVRLEVDYGNGWSYGCTVDGSKKGVFPQTFVQQAEQ